MPRRMGLVALLISCVAATAGAARLGEAKGLPLTTLKPMHDPIQPIKPKVASPPPGFCGVSCAGTAECLALGGQCNLCIKGAGEDLGSCQHRCEGSHCEDAAPASPPPGFCGVPCTGTADCLSLGGQCNLCIKGAGETVGKCEHRCAEGEHC